MFMTSAIQWLRRHCDDNWMMRHICRLSTGMQWTFSIHERNFQFRRRRCSIVVINDFVQPIVYTRTNSPANGSVHYFAFYLSILRLAIQNQRYATHWHFNDNNVCSIRYRLASDRLQYFPNELCLRCHKLNNRTYDVASVGRLCFSPTDIFFLCFFLNFSLSCPPLALLSPTLPPVLHLLHRLFAPLPMPFSIFDFLAKVRIHSKRLWSKLSWPTYRLIGFNRKSPVQVKCWKCINSTWMIRKITHLISQLVEISWTKHVQMEEQLAKKKKIHRPLVNR